MDTENKVVAYNKATNQNKMSNPNVVETKKYIMSTEQAPILEEYKLISAREKFRRDTKEFFNNTLLQDLKQSKDFQLKKINQNQLFLKQSESLLESLCKHRKKFDERSFIFLARSRHEIKKLHRDCRSLSEEITQGRENIKKCFHPSDE